MSRDNPPFIIAFASPKGGAGKSTSCLNIAGALLARGKTVHIVDFDQSETLWRWYSTNETARTITGLTVQKAPERDLDQFVKETWYNPADYVLIDLAGQLTREMLHLAVYATLTITPVKISEPDIVEANKLHGQLQEIQRRISKPILHRLLVNDVQNFLGAFETALLDELSNAALPRFNTIITHRVAYGETFMTGQPPHFAAQSRAPIAKAVDELNSLLREIDSLTLASSDTAPTNEVKVAA